MKNTILLPVVATAALVLLAGCQEKKGGEGTGDGPMPSLGTDTAPESGAFDPEPGTAVIGTVPPYGAAPGAFCVRNQDGLELTFLNSGTAASTPQSVTVSFRIGDLSEAETVQLPAIPAGETRSVTVPIPPGCFGPDCDFWFKWANQPDHAGRCIG